ncbi:hypothetical protein KJ359_004142 [Pestalotiopsis sp. 9143b]|nr:hypothetical protein KJ359_004142 [Pestalotiopsis sp. 9143b]
MGGQPRSRWATEGDFEKWRPKITRLYMVEGRVLRDVMKIMEEKHDFHATAKMYKQRILKWGLRKYKKKPDGPSKSEDQQVIVFQSQRQGSSGASSRTVSSGTEVGDMDVTELSTLHRDQDRARTVATGKRLHVNAAVSQRLSSPDVFTLPEEVILLSRHFGAGLLDQGHWGEFKGHNPESNKWWGRTILATQFLDIGKYKQAFNTLNQSFEQFSLLLDNPDPGLIQCAYLIALQLDDHQLGQKFLSFASEMASIKLPARHPLRIVLSKLRSAGTQQLRRHVLQILEVYIEALENRLGPSHSCVLVLYENMYDTLDFLSTERSMNFVETQTIQARQWGQIERLDAAGQVAEAQSARLALAFTYWRQDMFVEAETINDKVLEWLTTHDKSEYAKELDLWDSYHMRFRCKEKMGTKEEVTRVGREYINALIQGKGWENKRTAVAIGWLQKYYKVHGHMEEANELEKEVEAASRASGLLE